MYKQELPLMFPTTRVQAVRQACGTRSSTSSPPQGRPAQDGLQEAARHGLLPRPVPRPGGRTSAARRGDAEAAAADEGHTVERCSGHSGSGAPQGVPRDGNEDRRPVSEHGPGPADYISSDCSSPAVTSSRASSATPPRHGAASGPEVATPARLGASRTASREERSPELHMAAISATACCLESMRRAARSSAQGDRAQEEPTLSLGGHVTLPLRGRADRPLPDPGDAAHREDLRRRKHPDNWTPTARWCRRHKT